MHVPYAMPQHAHRIDVVRRLSDRVMAEVVRDPEILSVQRVAKPFGELIIHADRERVRLNSQPNSLRRRVAQNRSKEIEKTRQQMLTAMFIRCMLRANTLPNQNIANSQKHRKIDVRLQTYERILEFAFGTEGLVIRLTNNIHSAHADPFFGCESDKRRAQLRASASLQVRFPRLHASESDVRHEADDLLDRIVFESN